mgnify:CR=1 FL=1
MPLNKGCQFFVITEIKKESQGIQIIFQNETYIYNYGYDLYNGCRTSVEDKLNELELY